MGNRKKGIVKLLKRHVSRIVGRAFDVIKRLFGFRPVRVVVAIFYILSLGFGIPLIRPGQASGGSVSFVTSATSSTNNGNTITINKPTGTITNDVMIVLISAIGTTPTITPPGSGWTSIGSANETTNLSVQAFYKVTPSGDSGVTNYQFNSSTTTQLAGGISTYRGANTSSPIGTVGSSNSGVTTASNVAVTASTITPGSANSKIIGAYSSAHDSGQSFTPPTAPTDVAITMKERFDAASSRTGVGNIDATVELADIAFSPTTAFGSSAARVTNTDRWAAFQFELKNDGVARMLLLWDTAAGGAPTNWTFIDDYDGLFIRGDTGSNYGVRGGTATHTPTQASITQNYVNGGNSNNLSSGNNGSFWASQGHNHAGTVTIGSASNQPAYRTLRLIRYDAGVPNVIPANAIALFDDSPNTLPSGWIDLSASTPEPFYQKYLKIDSGSSANGGSNTHTHSLTWSSLAAASASTEGANPFLANGTTATTGHTHTAPAATATASITAIPPYVEPRLAKANADTATISIGITAMFDGDPGGGWVIRSQSSGIPAVTQYYQQFLRPSSVFNGTSQGSLTHSHANETSGNSGTNVGAGSNNNNLNLSIPPAISGNGHAHTETLAFNGGTTNVPEYFNVVVAEKVNFILQSYFWYNDDNTGTATDTLPNDPWANPDLTPDAPIITLPIAAADPPDLTRELRLRFQILINGNSLTANTVRFKLQYNASLSSSCTTATGGGWLDLGESTDTDKAWRFATSNVTGEQTLTASVFTSPATTVFGRYVKSNTGSLNNPAATIGDYIEFDYHIEDYAAAGATKYSFRVIENTGTLLSQYNVCPTLTTRPRVENQMRHGNFFINDSGDNNQAGSPATSLEGGFSWVD